MNYEVTMTIEVDSKANFLEVDDLSSPVVIQGFIYDIMYDVDDVEILTQLSTNQNVIQSLKCQLNGVSVVAEILLKRLKDSLNGKVFSLAEAKENAN